MVGDSGIGKKEIWIVVVGSVGEIRDNKGVD